MSKLNAHYLQKLGEEEINTGAMIVYTSADSVMTQLIPERIIQENMDHLLHIQRK